MRPWRSGGATPGHGCRTPEALHAGRPVRRPSTRSCEGGSRGVGSQARRLGRGAASSNPSAQDAAEGLAVDGKTLRGSQQQGAPGAPRLSALAHRLGLTLAQHAVADKTNAMPVAREFLRHVVLAGRGVPREALLTQRPLAQQLVAAGGAYGMVGTANQPQLREDMETVFALPPIATETRTVAQTVDGGHGRIAQRRLETSDVQVGYRDWPGLAQVFHLERQVVSQKTGALRADVVAGGTSLALERADAVRLLALVRGHWHIETKSHGVREVTCDDDRSQVRCGNIPQVMAALRHTAIGLMRRAGYTNIAAACRRFAAQPT
jgi:hypothetical protein